MQGLNRTFRPTQSAQDQGMRQRPWDSHGRMRLKSHLPSEANESSQTPRPGEAYLLEFEKYGPRMEWPRFLAFLSDAFGRAQKR